MGRIFGTDGARGVANTEISCDLAMDIGRALAMVLTEKSDKRPRVLIGRDTRISGDMLESAVAAGLCSVGANAELLGVGTLAGVQVMPESYQPMAIITQAPGGFIMLGLLMVVVNALFKVYERRKAGKGGVA